MKRILFFITIGLLIIIIINLSISLVSLWGKRDLLTNTQNQLTRAVREKGDLEAKIKKTSDPAFVEEQARDKLFLGKPGDVLVLIPTASPSAMEKENTDTTSIWQYWWKLFF